MASKQKLTHRPFKSGSIKNAEIAQESFKPNEPSHPQEDGSEIDDAVLYEQAMMHVKRLEGADKLATRSIKAKPELTSVDEDLLVMQKLDELVYGDAPFDFADTDEYIEACISGLDKQIVKALKRGDYSIQAHLDLHGYNREQARIKVADFIGASQKEGKRCVLIVHGRGLGSENNIPVLKNKLASWLTRGAIGKKVLAFTSAKPYDGGTGAVYVLLRHGER